MSDKQYAKRDAAWHAYLTSGVARNPRGDGIAQAAFNAGWEARKRAEYDTMIERVANHVHTSGENRHG